MKKLSRIFFALTIGLFLITPTLTSAATFNSNLAPDVTTTSVSSLQQFLKDEGLFSGSITATYGPATKAAVIKFQKQEGITATGTFGPLTRADANKVIAAHPAWTTTVSTTTTYQNVNNNTISSPTYSSNGIPAGASAQCGDGTYSFSLHRSGTCSHHGGVVDWL